EMENSVKDPGQIAYRAMLDIYGKLGDLEGVNRIWGKMKERGMRLDKRTYTSLITAFGREGKMEIANELYENMIRDGYKPSEHTIMAMINARMKSTKPFLNSAG